MSITLKSPRDKAEIVDLLIRNGEAFLFKGLKPEDETAVRNHLDWLRHQSDEIHVQATFFTEPGLRQTTLALRVTTVPPVPKEPT